ncbi:MAG: WG repeat-containing protein [Chitinophagaceae bacterium]|nr:WG repeat-containing protein [Chitinophagaceae bacterium]
MKLKLSGFVFLVFCYCQAALCQSLYPVSNPFRHEDACEQAGTPCGYKNYRNDLKIPMKYCDCGFFHHGSAAVSRQGQWGLIDSNGRAVTDFVYAKMSHFKNQYFVAQGADHAVDSSYVFNAKGQLIYKGVFGQYTFDRPLNRILIQPAVNAGHKKFAQYKIAIFDTFFNELITYYSEHEIHANFVNIENKGNPSHQNTYFELSETKVEDGKWNTLSALYKNTGQKIFDSVQVEGQILIQYPGTVAQQAAVIDSSLFQKLPFSAGYKNLKKFKHFPLYAFSKDRLHWGVLDSTFHEVIPANYHGFEISKIQHIEGFKKNKSDSIYFRFTVSGQLTDSSKVTQKDQPLKIDETIKAMNSGHLISEAGNGKYQVADLSGKILMKSEYDEIRYEGGYFVAGIKKQHSLIQYGLFDKNGKMLFKPVYDQITYLHEGDESGHFILSKKDKAVPDICIAILQ